MTRDPRDAAAVRCWLDSVSWGRIRPDLRPRRAHKEPALDVLDTLRRASGPLSVGQIADDTGRTPKSLYRVLARLERLGYVVRAGTYRGHGPIPGILWCST